MRLIKLLATAVLAWALVVGGAAAQNGLERFEREIKPQIQLEKLTYGSAQSLGNAGFVLTDVVAVLPANPSTGDKASTIEIDRLTVEALDFDRMKDITDDEMPRFAKLKIEGLTGDEEIFAALGAYGVPRVPVDVVLDYRLDGAARTFTLNRLDIALRGQAKLGLSLLIEGISEKSSEVADAMDDGRLRTASLTIEDSGLLATLLPPLAKEEGETAEGLVAMVLVTLAAFSDGQGSATLKALDAIASFVGDWKAPKGILMINLAPAKTASLSDLDQVMEPDALVDIFGLSASYPATRNGAAKAGPAAK
ncbi:MAG: hypothetical protein KIS73_04965 [Enhydrobacter sp.]|nr:hypothetical protein [Enhydrobacter sp.]